jgi:outer membrane protein insertion porin family
VVIIAEGAYMRKLFAGLILLFILFPLFSQDEEEWYYGKPIEDIVFVGLNTVDPDVLEPVVEPYIGKEFSIDLFWELNEKLTELDFFKEFIPMALPGGDPPKSEVIIQYEVQERPVIESITFSGNRRIRERSLLDVVLIKEGDMASNPAIKEAEAAIRQLYLEKGFPYVEVNGVLESSEEGNTLTFEIDEGAQTVIKEINFVGNSFASGSTLRGVLKSKQQSLFNKGIYRQINEEQDIENLLNYYRDKGFVNVSIPAVDKDIVEDPENERKFIILTYHIEEGEQYTFGGMNFEGNQILTEEELQEMIRLEPGDILNYGKLVEDIRTIYNSYYENGYVNVVIVDNFVEDEEQNIRTYNVTITENDRSYIENIIISGNEKTKDHVILRELPFQEGEIFSFGKIQQGLMNLNNLQYFQSISPETPPGSAEGLVDLIINVEEMNTADIQFGVNFGGGTGFPLAGYVKWQDKNFMGRGQVFGIETEISPIKQMLSFNFQENWLFGYRWSGGVNLSMNRSKIDNVPQDFIAPIFPGGTIPDPYDGHYVFTEVTEYNGLTYQPGDAFPGVPDAETITAYNLKTDYEYAKDNNIGVPDEYLMSYINWDLSLSGNTGYRFITPLGTLYTGTSLSTTLGYVNYDPTKHRPADPILRGNLKDWKLTNRWALTAYLDNRDIVYNPENGYFLKQSLTFTGGFLFGYRHYIRTSSKADGYITLWDIPVGERWSFKTVLALHSGISFILPQFWVPQGYDRLETPSELYVDGMYIARGWSRKSGRALWDNWLELRIPILPQIVWFDTFFDAAAIWDQPSMIGSLGIENMLFGFGAGIRFTIPQFPIRLYLSKRFKIEDGSVQWQEGNIFNDTLDFVFAIGFEIY